MVISVFRSGCKTGVFPFRSNPTNLGLAYKVDLDFWDCFWNRTSYIIAEFHETNLHYCISRNGKTPSASQMNIVLFLLLDYICLYCNYLYVHGLAESVKEHS